jgi:hypothetical protein
MVITAPFAAFAKTIRTTLSTINTFDISNSLTLLLRDPRKFRTAIFFSSDLGCAGFLTFKRYFPETIAKELDRGFTAPK